MYMYSYLKPSMRTKDNFFTGECVHVLSEFYDKIFGVKYLYINPFKMT